jgi:hypothetical protein
MFSPIHPALGKSLFIRRMFFTLFLLQRDHSEPWFRSSLSCSIPIPIYPEDGGSRDL